MKGSKTVLIVGLNTRPVVQLAKRNKFKTIVVDYFRDLDLLSVADKLYSILNPQPGKSIGAFCDSFDRYDLLKLAKEALKRHRIDFIVPGTAIGDDAKILRELGSLRPVVGNSPERVEFASNRERLLNVASKMGVVIPNTVVVSSREEAVSKSRTFSYPVVVKPIRGFGGLGITKVTAMGEVEEAYLFAVRVGGADRVLIQEYVKGKPVSIPVISNGKEAMAMAVGEQLLGLSRYGQVEEFGYSGNVFPLDASDIVLKEVGEMAEGVVEKLGLRGYSGVDMVITEEDVPVLMEVNPRLQSLVECVEMAYGVNMFQAYLDACLRGVLPSKPSFRFFAAKLVVFSRERAVVGRLSDIPEAVDLTPEQVIVPQHEPVCSLVARGGSRSGALKRVEERVPEVYERLKPVKI